MNNRLAHKISIYSANGNLIRTLCALAVIIHHSFYLSQNIYDPLYYLTNGQIGIGGFAVAVFFFFSGLYVTKSLMSKKNHKTFLISRCKRIFPQLWVVILISTFIIGPIFTSFKLTDYFTSTETYKYLFNCVLIPVHELPGVFENNVYGPTVNGALWTLPVEFLCYLSLLVISIFVKNIIKNKKLYKILLSAAFAISVLLLAASEYLNIQLLKAAFSATSFFFIGSLYYLFADKIKFNILAFIISLIGVVVSFFTPMTNYLLILLLPYAVSFLSLYPKQIKTKTCLLNYSYEIYLIGFPIQQIIVCLFNGSMQIWLNQIIAIAITIIIVLIINLVKKFY